MKELKKDKYGRTELTYYIINKNTTRAINMIKNADIDFNESDIGGYTYLHFAAQNEQPEIVKALLEKGAKVDQITRNGGTPLWIAVSEAKCHPIEHTTEVIRILLDAGADPNEVVNGIPLKKMAYDINIPQVIKLICAKDDLDNS